MRGAPVNFFLNFSAIFEEAFCVARPHSFLARSRADFHTSRDVFSYIRRSRRSVSCARYSGSDAAHRQWRNEKLISTATEPVFAYPIKVARNSPTKPSAIHYASWFGHSVFSGPVVSSGNFVCSEGFGTKHENLILILLPGLKSAQQSFAFLWNLLDPNLDLQRSQGGLRSNAPISGLG